ncbi:hypothetical protein FRC14_006494 [Serendipita sp. 396]|nr:hypothetical protein FRC14_006494 [Serendipita sp. 396]KAG8779036.1 hypothetical protein FRC15_010399 [Serendipita sp. 397]
MTGNTQIQSWRLALTSILLFVQVVVALHNITIDDTDSAFVYNIGWLMAIRDDCYGGRCHYTITNSASFSYSLTGAYRVYILGEMLHDTSIRTIVDGKILRTTFTQSPVRGVLWDSGMLFSPSKTYDIQVVKEGPSGNGNDVYIDAFVLTVPDEGEYSVISSSDTSPTSSPTSSTSSPASSSSGITGTTSSNQSTQNSTDGGNANTMSTILSGSSVTSNSINPFLPNLGPTAAVSGSSAGGNGSHNMKASTKAAIIGGTLGVFAVICVIAVLLFYLRRKRRSRRDSTGPAPLEPEPYNTSLNRLDLGTTASMGVADISSPPLLSLKEMHEIQGAKVSPEISVPQTSLVVENPRNPVMNRISYHPSERQSLTSQSLPWLMANPPAYTVHPILGHMHASGETLSEFRARDEVGRYDTDGL